MVVFHFLKSENDRISRIVNKYHEKYNQIDELLKKYLRFSWNKPLCDRRESLPNLFHRKNGGIVTKNLKS